MVEFVDVVLVSKEKEATVVSKKSESNKYMVFFYSNRKTDREHLSCLNKLGRAKERKYWEKILY
jgi:hypothetical protein